MAGGQKVLYVDDEALLKMAFVETLKQQGFDARGATSGKEALELVAAQVPDVLILDVMMKPMDGWETLSRIRAQDPCRDIPVIMQTGKSLTLKDVLEYGTFIDDYLIKPVRLPDLIRAIEGVFERRKIISDDVSRARSLNNDPALVTEYGTVRQRVIVSGRLITVLARIYPIQPDGTIEEDIDIPELQEVITRHQRDINRCEELRSILFPE